ncbi:hypothetical protein FORC77_3998 [Vibrio vulnificus]|nr:hypothetical protein FORC77_3998 [Vibrio vulnificus]
MYFKNYQFFTLKIHEKNSLQTIAANRQKFNTVFVNRMLAGTGTKPKGLGIFRMKI